MRLTPPTRLQPSSRFLALPDAQLLLPFLLDYTSFDLPSLASVTRLNNNEDQTTRGKVEGLQVGLTLGLEDVEGSLKLTPLQCGCFVGDITIKLDGRASWVYQGLVYAFWDQIEVVLENAIEATCHVPDAVGCYKEVYKILKLGQYFAAYEWCMSDAYRYC